MGRYAEDIYGAVCEQGFRTQRSMRTTILVFASSLVYRTIEALQKSVRRSPSWLVNVSEKWE